MVRGRGSGSVRISVDDGEARERRRAVETERMRRRGAWSSSARERTNALGFPGVKAAHGTAFGRLDRW